MGQDSRLGCSSLKVLDFRRIRPGVSDIRDKCFKGIGLHSKPQLKDEEETQSKVEEGKPEPLTKLAETIQKPAGEQDEDDVSDEEEASSQGSFVDGETGKQEDKETGEMEETIKCSLEGEKSEERAKTPSFTFRKEEVQETHRGEDSGHGKEKGASGTRCRYAKVEMGEGYSAKERGHRGKGVDTVTPAKMNGYVVLVRTPTRDLEGWISVEQRCEGQQSLLAKRGSRSAPPLGQEGTKVLKSNRLGGRREDAHLQTRAMA
ncbi:hypothetical protein AAC387_Pa09g0157 [Persea americana]